MCDRATCLLNFFFFPNFFFLRVGACLGDLKISRLVYLCKACLCLEYLGKESDSVLSEFLKGQKKKKKLETVEMQI